MKNLGGLRVLLVEDNFIVADSLRALITACGGEVAAMVPTANEALALLASAAVDIAVLDIHLRGGKVDPLADHLAAKGVPFVFLSGYGDDSILPERLRGRPRLNKPVEVDQLFATIAALLDKQGTGNS